MRKPIALLALAGTLFSGVLTAQFFIAGSCSAGCEFLLGYPTCAYGFVLFALLLLFSIIEHPRSREILMTVAGVGVLFSLVFAVKELSARVWGYPLGLPNCVYGLVMFAGIGYLAYRKK